MQIQKEKFSNYDQFVNNYSLSAPENFNFAFDVVDAKAVQNPGQPAMIHIDDDQVRREYDMVFFSKESSRLANALQEQGIGKGDRIMIILYRRVEFWIAMLALHKLGAVAIPSPGMLRCKDIVYRVNFAGIKGVIAEHSVVQNVQEARRDCASLNVLVQVGGQEQAADWLDYHHICSQAEDLFPRPDHAAGGSDALLIYFSSGTTGPPKMVEHTHNYPLGHITTAVYWHDLEPGDVHLTLADTGWGKAAWGKFYGQWMAEAIIFVFDYRTNFSPAILLQVLAEHKVNSFCAPPTVYRFLIREDLSKYDFSQLRHCTTAGELLNEGVFHKWKESTGLSIYEGYGQTETCLQIATFPFMEPKAGSIGRPAPGWEIVLLDENDDPCPNGVEGEICVALKNGGPLGLFTGYLQEPEKTVQATRNGFYRTGDKAWRDEDGYYWFLGRVDDLIKSSGYRIGPFEVESALITHPAVVEAAVTAVPDPVRGQAVKATLVISQDYEAGEDLTKEIQDHVKEVTAPYKYPRIIEYVDQLPKTISGKIKRAEIRAEDLKKYEES